MGSWVCGGMDNVAGWAMMCGNQTVETVLIGRGDSFSLKTQAGPAYGPSTSCVVKYKVPIAIGMLPIYSSPIIAETLMPEDQILLL